MDITIELAQEYGDYRAWCAQNGVGSFAFENWLRLRDIRPEDLTLVNAAWALQDIDRKLQDWAPISLERVGVM